MAESNKGLLLLARFILFVAAIAFLAAGIGISTYLWKNRPKPKRRRPPQMAPLVEVQKIELKTHQVVISKNGTVIPSVEVALKPRVTGEIIEIHQDFLEGGLVKEGDVLVRVEPRDYELAITTQEAQVEAARSEGAQERGRQDVARREWELLDTKEKASDLDKELVLRKPQLRQKQADVRAAEAALEKAKLDLERTVIKAPCNGIILEANVDVGDQASTQSAMATIAGTDTYWIQVPIPVDELKWIQIPRHRGEQGSPARVFSGTGSAHEGRVLSLQGELESQGLLARVLIEVPDPLGLKSGGKANPLLLGEYVRVEIAGASVENAVVIPRSALREGTAIWVADAGSKMRILQPDVVYSDTEIAVLRGLDAGTRIIITDVATPIDGMDLQVKGDPKKSVPGASRGPGAGKGKGAKDSQEKSGKGDGAQEKQS